MIWWCTQRGGFWLFFSAWPALTSSHLSLLLLANTLDSAAELALHNPDCRTWRRKKILHFQSDVRFCNFQTVIFVCSLKMRLNSIKLRTKVANRFLGKGNVLALPMAPAGSSRSPWDYCILHILCGPGLLWNLLLSSSFTASSRVCAHAAKTPSHQGQTILCNPFLMLLHWWEFHVPCTNIAQEPLTPFTCGEFGVIVIYWQITTFPWELSLRSSLRVKAAALRSSCEKPASSSSSWGQEHYATGWRSKNKDPTHQDRIVSDTYMLSPPQASPSRIQ